MLAAPDPDVVNAALAAIRWPDDQELVAAVVGHLDDRSTAGAAVDALARSGDAALAMIDEPFAATSVSANTVVSSSPVSVVRSVAPKQRRCYAVTFGIGIARLD